MNRAFVVASTEFMTLIKTKAFIIGLLMMPVIVGLSIAFNVFAATHVDRDDHHFAVIDHTGVLYEAITRAAADHNGKSGPANARTGPYFTPTSVDPVGRSLDDVKFDLSEQVRKKQLFAFVEIPADVLDVSLAKLPPIQYYTETPSYDALPDFLEKTLDKEISTRRFAKAAVDAALVERLTTSPSVTTLGLVERSANGTIQAAKKVNEVLTVVLPIGMMYLLFIAIMTSAPQLLTAVIEEKMSKISEVLISSITPYQLMAGKLMGVVAVAVLLTMVYFLGGTYAAFQSGHWEFIRPVLMGWFVVFLLCAVLMYGAVFVAIGSACSDLKDSQSMMQPVMILLMLPMLMIPVLLKDPNSTIAVGASLFPTATPFIMLMRLGMTPAPPLWQVGLGVVLMVVTTVLFIWAAGRIFRVGLLMQGKAPTFAELIRWIRA